MATGDVNTYETTLDASEIDTALSGNVVVADTIIPVLKGSNKVIFVVIKA